MTERWLTPRMLEQIDELWSAEGVTHQNQRKLALAAVDLRHDLQAADDLWAKLRARVQEIGCGPVMKIITELENEGGDVWDGPTEEDPAEEVAITPKTPPTSLFELRYAPEPKLAPWQKRIEEYKQRRDLRRSSERTKTDR